MCHRALATLIGVGVPCLVFIGLCFLLSDKDEEEAEAEDDDDIEAKGNDEDHKDTMVSGYVFETSSLTGAELFQL